MVRMRKFKWVLMAAALGALVSLSACHFPNPVTEPCPTFGILGDAEQMTAFNGTSRDLTAVEYRASLAGASLSCYYNHDKRRPAVKGALKVNLSVERGPALSSTEIKVPYFVAVLRGTKYVLARDEFSETFDLKQGARVAAEEEVPVTIPLAKNMRGDNYQVVVGIILTPAEVDYNRAQSTGH